jgi:DNA repair protein RecO (recombination protein O)
VNGRERSLRVEAVVLRHTDWGEADRILSLMTREHGKLRCIAKGVRKLRSRKAGHLEPFTRVALMLARGYDLWIVTQAETVEAYLAMREDLVRTGYSAYVVELVDRFTYEEGENPSLYGILVDALARINHEPDPFLAVRYFEVRLLDVLGFRPQLFHCVGCGAPIQAQDQYFSFQQGGILLYANEARPASMTALKFLRYFQRSTYPEASRAVLAAAVMNELETLLHAYLTYLLERELNSPAFLREVRK